MSLITMRRGGNILELSLAGRSLPPDVEQRLKNELRYTHLTALRGVDAVDPVTGEYRPTRAEIRLLYTIGRNGRFNASIGWQSRVKRVVHEMGHRLQIENLDPIHPRPNRYEVNWDRLFSKMDLRVKQDEILAAIEEEEFGLLHVPAGVGKTFLLGAHAVAHPHARIHIVTDGIDIINRIYRHMVKYIPNVGLVGGGKCRFGPHVTVISADSLHKVGEGFNDPRSPMAADYVFFDEVHKAGAQSILEQLRKYRDVRMFGLSANIGDRFDGADAQLEGLFGETIYTMTYQEAESLGLVAPIHVEWVKMDFEVPKELREASGTKLDKYGIWRHEERNRRLAAKVREFADDVQVLVMVATVDHAVRLKQHLPEFRLCYDQCKEYTKYVRDGLLDPQDEPPMNAGRRERMRTDFEEGTLKKVIATDVWSTGVDFVGLPVLARADGRDSRILDTQIPCRANRIDGDRKPYATLIDCMDIWHDTGLRRSNSRKRTYIKYGWKQVGLDTRRIGVSAAKQVRR